MSVNFPLLPKEKKLALLQYAVACCILAYTVLPFLVLCRYVQPQRFEFWWPLDRTSLIYSLKSAIPGTRYVSIWENILWIIAGDFTAAHLPQIVLIDKLFACCIVLLFCASLAALFRSLNTCVLHLEAPRFLLFLSLVFFFVLNAIRRLDYFFYDMVTTTGYTLGLSLSMLYAASMISYYHKGNPVQLVWQFLLAYVICGTIEYNICLPCFIAFLFAVLTVCKKKRLPLAALVQILLCLIMFFLHIKAPGNADGAKFAAYARTDAVHQAESFAAVSAPAAPAADSPAPAGNAGAAAAEPASIYSLTYFAAWCRSFRVFYSFSWSYVFRVQSLLLLALIYCFAAQGLRRIRVAWLLCIGAGAELIGFAMFFASYVVGMLGTWDSHLVQTPHVWLCMNHALLLLTLLRFFAGHYNLTLVPAAAETRLLHVERLVRSPFMFLFCILLFSCTREFPLHHAYADILKGRARHYDQKIERIYQDILSSGADGAIVEGFASSENPNALIFGNENAWNSTAAAVEPSVQAFFAKPVTIVRPGQK